MTIDIYSTPTCGFCKSLKEFLKSAKIDYAEHNVALSDKDLTQMQSFSGGFQVPVIVLNKGTKEQVVQTGFDPQWLRKNLSL